MPNEDLSRLHFQKKISTYCDVRIAPVAPDWVVENIRPYLLGLITFRKTPALASNRYDWRQIARDCGIDEALTPPVKKHLRRALDAIMRWLKEPPVEDDVPKGKRPQATPKARATGQFAPSPTNQHHEVEEVESSPSPGRPGPKPRPVSDKPEPLFEANEDLLDLYTYLNAYIERHRKVLLARAHDPGTLFVKNVKTTSIDAAYNQTTFYEAWRLAIQRYGIYNPYTGRGAIKGLLPHGPHNVRDVLATHILKQTGSYEQASYAIQDTPDVVQQHYGRFLPQDKAALATRILNQVWEAA